MIEMIVHTVSALLLGLAVGYFYCNLKWKQVTKELEELEAILNSISQTFDGDTEEDWTAPVVKLVPKENDDEPKGAA